jgi:hypothetical protein
MVRDHRLNGRKPGRLRLLVLACSCAAAMTVSLGLLASSASADADNGSIKGVDLTFYPWVDSTPAFPATGTDMTEDLPLLNALAKRYTKEDRTPRMQEFLLTWLPNRLFDIAYAGVKAPPGFNLDPTTDEGSKRMLWLAHVSGWNVGVFSRKGFQFGTPPATLATVPIQFNPFLAGTLATVGQARAAALDPDAADVLDFNRHAVYGNHPPGPFTFPATIGFGTGLGDLPWYAYDLGFLESLNTTNRPPSVPNDPNWVNYDDTPPGKVADAVYSIGDPAYLAQARGQLDQVQQASGTVASRYATALTDPAAPSEPTRNFQPISDGWAAQGKLVWSGPPFPGPNVTTWTQQDWIDFRDSSTAYVQAMQAQVMMDLVAYATQDVDLGRRAAVMSGVVTLLIENSIYGNFDPMSNSATTMEQALPKFTSKDCTIYKKC